MQNVIKDLLNLITNFKKFVKIIKKELDAFLYKMVMQRKMNYSKNVEILK